MIMRVVMSVRLAIKAIWGTKSLIEGEEGEYIFSCSNTRLKFIVPKRLLNGLLILSYSTTILDTAWIWSEASTNT